MVQILIVMLVQLSNIPANQARRHLAPGWSLLITFNSQLETTDTGQTSGQGIKNKDVNIKQFIASIELDTYFAEISLNQWKWKSKIYLNVFRKYGKYDVEINFKVNKRQGDRLPISLLSSIRMPHNTNKPQRRKTAKYLNANLTDC